jgi:hypothetical protein
VETKRADCVGMPLGIHSLLVIAVKPKKGEHIDWYSTDGAFLDCRQRKEIVIPTATQMR